MPRDGGARRGESRRASSGTTHYRQYTTDQRTTTGAGPRWHRRDVARRVAAWLRSAEHTEARAIVARQVAAGAWGR